MEKVKHTNKIRAAIAGIAVFALVAALGLVGCSSGSSNSNNSNANANANTNKSTEKVELQIFAANSLSKALEEVQTLYTEKNPNVTFSDTQYKGSGELNSMLEAGSYADIEITASKGTMDTAVQKGYVTESTRFNMFKNDLVIVAAENSSITECTLQDVAEGKYTVAVGDDSVPAGNYANQALSTVGCFVDPDGKTGSESAGKKNDTDAYAGTPLAGKVVIQSSVGNVCKLAQSGEADVAFVYTSDVYRFGGVKIVGTVDASTHKNIVYPGAVCAQSKYADASNDFLKWSTTDAEAIKIWQKWGFELA